MFIKKLQKNFQESMSYHFSAKNNVDKCNRRLGHLLVPLTMMVLFLISNTLDANELEIRRIRSGLKIFRSFLSADQHISKKVEGDGKLLLLLVYKTDNRLAEDFAGELRHSGKGDQRGKIRRIPIKVEITNDTSLTSFDQRRIAGVYLVEHLGNNDLNSIIDYGITHQAIVYSPFEGHVEKGVLGGLAVEARVRPYINLQTMRVSEISVKSFFLKIAKHYDN